MSFRFLLLLTALTACADEAGNATAQQAKPGNQAAPQVLAPADAAPYNVNDVIGATPGPCGSTRATEFLGRTYTPDMDAAIMRSSGATQVRVRRPVNEEDADTLLIDRRINLALNDSGQIILLDCG